MFIDTDQFAAIKVRADSADVIMRRTARHTMPAALPTPAALIMLCRMLTRLCETSARRRLGRDDWDRLNAGVRELAASVWQYGFNVALSAATIAAEKARARAEGFAEGKIAGERRAAAGRHARPRGERPGHLRLVGGGR
jgi:hypothetical protein